MTDLPEFVYLVTVDTEWPVSAIVAYGTDQDAEQVAEAFERRAKSQNVSRRGQVHVWKARLIDVREVDLIPSTVVKASIREREDTA